MTTDKKAFAPSMVILTEEPRVLRPPDLSLDGILGRFPGLAKVPALGITGSTAAGWGNPYSDIDIYAFTDGECELPEDDSVESWRSTDPRGLNRINWIGRYDDALVDLKVWPLDAPAAHWPTSWTETIQNSLRSATCCRTSSTACQSPSR
jgi:hypothetical protein